MKLTNPWIGYLERGYEQIMASIIARLPTFAPEITDFSFSNPFIKSASVFAGVGEHLNFYIDARARESFLATARDYASVVQFAAQVDYRVRGVLPASVDLTFYVDVPQGEAIALPLGTLAKTTTGLEYRTTSAASLLAGQLSVSVPARNWRPVTDFAAGQSSGQPGQRFALGADVVDNALAVRVNGTPWESVETFAYSTTSGQQYRGGRNAEGGFELLFGDGLSGAVPGAGAAVSVDFYTSNGAAGNVAAGTITELSTALTGLRVRNPQRAAGGADAEGLEELRKRIPLSLRTLERAVAPQDYIDLALLAPGVAQAGLVFSCGKSVELYVAPIGGGLASSGLLESVESYFESKRMVTTKVKALPAGEVLVKLNIRLKVRANYYRDQTAALALANVLSFLSVENQQINGSLQIGDVYQVLEDTEGVEWSEITRLTTVPYARPVGHEHPLTWTVETQPGSLFTVAWRILLLGGGEFQLLRDNIYVGTFEADQQVPLDDVRFTVLAGSYATGDTWEFYTYPYNGSLTLREQSVPVTLPELVVMDVTGGLV